MSALALLVSPPRLLERKHLTHGHSHLAALDQRRDALENWRAHPPVDGDGARAVPSRSFLVHAHGGRQHTALAERRPRALLSLASDGVEDDVDIVCHVLEALLG